MPTDLDLAFARKRAAQALCANRNHDLLFWFIICLGMLGLMFEVLGH
jgi:hypothetical protein